MICLPNLLFNLLLKTTMFSLSLPPLKIMPLLSQHPQMIYLRSLSQPHKQICSHSSSNQSQLSNHNSTNLMLNQLLIHPNKNSLLSPPLTNKSNKMISSINSSSSPIRNSISSSQRQMSLQRRSLVRLTWWVWSIKQHRCQSSNPSLPNNTTISSQHLVLRRVPLLINYSKMMIFLRCLQAQAKSTSNPQHLRQRQATNSLTIYLREDMVLN